MCVVQCRQSALLAKLDAIRKSQRERGLRDDAVPIILFVSQLGEGLRFYTDIALITHIHIRDQKNAETARQWIRRANNQLKLDWLKAVRVVIPESVYERLNKGELSYP